MCGDLLHIHRGLTTRVKPKRMQEALTGLLKLFRLKIAQNKSLKA